MTHHLRRGHRSDGHRGGGRVTSTTLTLDIQQQQVVTQRRSRNCRITIGVDVSGSMVSLINAVIRGIEKINSVLEDGDLVSIVDFAEEIRTIFPYLSPRKVDWTDLKDKLKGHVRQSDRGVCTALWDAIGHIIDTTPRDTKYRQYRPELVIFTDGHDNFSKKYNRQTIQDALGSPRIAHVHITIIDASEGGNHELKAICAPIEHCTFAQVEASQEAVQRAFVDVMTAISRRLTITVESNDPISSLIAPFNRLFQTEPFNTPSAGTPSLHGRPRGPVVQLDDLPAESPTARGPSPAVNQGNRGGRGRGRGRGQGRGRERGRGRGRNSTQ